jgi:hypothetical protein
VNKPMPKWYASAQRRISHFFASEHFKGVEEKIPSPCGRYIFVIEKYQRKEWSFFRGVIYSKEKEIADIKSVAHHFWYCWVKKDNKSYLLCNQESQGYVIAEPDTGNLYPYRDPKAKSGWGLSWKEVKPSPNGKLIAVQGDYMEAHREVAIFDFSDPTTPPLPKIKTLGENLKRGYLVLKGWEGNHTVLLEHTKSDADPTIVRIGV